MNKTTAKALEQSIEHWERMRDGKRKNRELPYDYDCALCKRFQLKNEHHDCIGCPIFEATKEQGCELTPYDKAFEAYEDHGLSSLQFKAAAQDMIDFLISLREQPQ